MKKQLLFFFLLVSAATIGQNFNWVTSGGQLSDNPSSNLVRSLIRDSQGNIYHIFESNQSVECQGIVSSNPSGTNTFIHKFNASGELLYIKRIGTNFYPLNMVLDDDDNLYVLGNLYGTYALSYEDLTFSATAQYRNHLFKINPEGEYQWHVMTDTSGSYGSCPLLLYADDHIYTQTDHTTIGKLDMAGAVEATLTPDAFANYNAQTQIFFSDAKVLPDGDLVFYGCAYATITYGTTVLVPETVSGNAPNIALKTSPLLELEWAKMYNGLNTAGKTLAADASGNLYFGVRVNTTFTAGSDTLTNPNPGTTNYTDAILKADTDGNPLWIKPIGLQSRVETLATDANGGILFGGSLSNSISIGDFALSYSDGRAYIAHISADGVIENAFNFGAGSFAATNHIIPGPDGAFLVSGHLTGGASAEFGCLEATDTDGFFLGEFTEDPIHAPIPTITQSGATLTASPAFDGNIQWYLDGVLISGAIAQTLDISQPGSYSVTYAYEFGCETQVSANYLSAETFNGATSFIVHPNPSAGIFQLELPSGTFAYTVSDLNGRLVASGEIRASESIDLSSVENGMYVLRLESENGTASRKIVKQ